MVRDKVATKEMCSFIFRGYRMTTTPVLKRGGGNVCVSSWSQGGKHTHAAYVLIHGRAERFAVGQLSKGPQIVG